MAIFTRFGTRVQIITAREVPVYIEKRPGEIKWHYKEPKKTKKTESIDVCDIWHVTAKCFDDRPGHGSSGSWICDGAEIDTGQFVADDGIREIHDECRRIAAQPQLMFMAITACFPGGWQRAGSAGEAIDDLKKAWGANFVKEHGYRVYLVASETHMDELGNVVFRKDAPEPELVRDCAVKSKRKVGG